MKLNFYKRRISQNMDKCNAEVRIDILMHDVRHENMGQGKFCQVHFTIDYYLFLTLYIFYLFSKHLPYC